MGDFLGDYLSTQPIVIADTNSTARVGLASSLVKMGAQRSLLSLTATFEEAKSEINRVKPKLVLSDFELGRQSGLDLIVEQKGLQVSALSKQMTFLLVTGSASQSTVARAAEEDVDSFILKPYAFDTLRKTLAQTIQSKLHPSAYMLKIDEGKAHLLEARPDEAILCFSEAMKLDATPTLACFYSGQAEAMKQALGEARGKYSRGLSMNKIHYKCLTGLFDLLMKEQRPTEAYEVVKKLAQYFPANPKRLASVLRLAIVTSNYDDIEGYYRIFTLLEERPEELVRYICSAMAVTGKHYLRQGVRTRAFEVFDKVAISAAGRTGYLKYLVETLFEFDCGKHGVKYLKYFPPGAQSKEDYLVSRFLSDFASGQPRSELIQTGRALLLAGIRHWQVHRLMIVLSEQANFRDAASDLRTESSQIWPERAGELPSEVRLEAA